MAWMTGKHSHMEEAPVAGDHYGECSAVRPAPSSHQPDSAQTVDVFKTKNGTVLHTTNGPHRLGRAGSGAHGKETEMRAVDNADQSGRIFKDVAGASQMFSGETGTAFALCFLPDVLG